MHGCCGECSLPKFHQHAAPKLVQLIKTAPKCLCAVLLSPLAKQAGIKPGIAITIPKRCNIKNRPVGKKCGIGAAGECGKTPLPSAAASLSPCLAAAKNAAAKVPPTCCTKVYALLKTAPKCLCAVLLSPLAKQSGIKPAIAITIPKRCNIKNRPVGKKCGSK
ncbi:hypothetical protein HYC85_023894 [Camellia sinensis]|uniref:Bifunctional inhibitor/plant lipid transfer protein/seed storage helical domain-containing protein n=1 Tax=Camellia sinensis TaxID=4442 RepID=A0A7J7GH62_CAMSI|nr:hypothetical protein HYC85_023894 [Camellia sinensis]